MLALTASYKTLILSIPLKGMTFSPVAPEKWAPCSPPRSSFIIYLKPVGEVIGRLELSRHQYVDDLQLHLW